MKRKRQLPVTPPPVIPAPRKKERLPVTPSKKNMATIYRNIYISTKVIVSQISTKRRRVGI
jgi:hypothetical protein